MYSPKVIEARLELALKKGALSGADPIRYSPAYCAQVVAHLDELRSSEGALKRPLAPDELAFISNERLLCQLDFLYWAERYAVVLAHDGRMVPYRPNIAQRIMGSICGEMEEEGVAIMTQQLKGRQLGVSTDTELRIAHRVLFYPYTNALVASSDPEKSWKMAEMMRRAWASQPWWLRPLFRTWESGEVLYEAPDLGSAVTIAHGTAKSGVGRGDTPLIAHCSELPDWNNLEENLEAALLNAMHPNEYTFLVLESTAKGREDWWHRKWKINKELWPTRRSTFRPVFLPWYVSDDKWPTEAWLRARRQLFARWRPEDATAAMMRRAASYVASNDTLLKHFGRGWEMPLEKAFYWEVARDEALRSGTLSKFLEEKPSDDIEAFQAAGTSVFPYEVILSYKDKLPDPLGLFSVEGDEVATRLTAFPASERLALDPIPLRAQVRPKPLAWRLMPLRWRGQSDTDPTGKLLVWEAPRDGQDYYIGVDCGQGVGRDKTCVQVVRRGTPHRAEGQVAEWASPWASAFDVWPVVLALATFYTVRRADGEGWQQPLLAIETAENGLAVQNELRKRGYTRFHRTVKLGAGGAQVEDIGWRTTSASRPALLDFCIKAVMDGWVEICSPWLLEELQGLEVSETARRLRIDHGSGGHDDRVFAFAIPLYSMSHSSFRRSATSAQAERQRRDESLLEDPQAPTEEQFTPTPSSYLTEMGGGLDSHGQIDYNMYDPV